MTQDQWKRIGYIVVSCVLAIAVVLGYDFGVLQPRIAAQVQLCQSPSTSQAVAASRITSLSVTTLTLGTQTFNGAVKGSSASVLNGALIAHGFTTTPTYAVCGIAGAWITETVAINAMNATSITVNISDHAGAGATNATQITCISIR